MAVMADLRSQAVTGVAPPQSGEALIRDAWPGVASAPTAAGLAMRCYHAGFLSILTAPIGWLILSPFLLQRLAGFLLGTVTRYRLTNRRLMIARGAKAVPKQEVPLDQIKDVKLIEDDMS